MKRALLLIGAAILILVAVLAGRALSVPSMQLAAPAAPPLAIDRAEALARLTRAIQFRTISHGEGSAHEPVEHDAFVTWLAQAYPRMQTAMRREVAGGRSLLYTWPGSDPSLAPVLLMGHYDVVPVEPGTESNWEQPPFSGAVAGGFVWGRGTLDDKMSVIALCESAELLLAEGFRPRRTILFAFGHDEELGGLEGAAQIATLLAARGVRLHAVVDEAGIIAVEGMPGLTRPIALVGIAEKGMASVELLASGAGGHSSMPPRRTQVGAIAGAVNRVQDAPFPARVRGATKEMFRWVAPEMPFGRRLVMANLWLFAPLLDSQARELPPLNAMLRTTTAPTMISGGVKDNVIPANARAVVNFRILPGDSVDGVVAHVRDAVGDDAVRVQLLRGGQNPSGVSDPLAPQFRTLQRTIVQTFPGVLVAPYLVVGATDARHFQSLSQNVYRFLPARLTQSDIARLHGTNERIAVDDYFDAIRFYRMLAVNFSR